MMDYVINSFVSNIEDWLVEVRRDIHQYPELGTKEYRTSKIVSSIMKDLGVEVETGFYDTGVVGLIRGATEGGTIALRADMDALPLEEKTGLPFASQNPGVMHACGHDGHVAMGLGIAKVLMKLKDNIRGNVKLIFQPAEEIGKKGGGARPLIKEGVLSNPRVNAIVGMHMWPQLPIGSIGSRVGPILASADPFSIDISGKGGHASQPNKCIDPIVISSFIVTAIHTIISRNIDPFHPAVISIGKLICGETDNIIPSNATMEGTIRAFFDEDIGIIIKRISSISKNIAESMGGEASFNHIIANRPVVNELNMVNIAKQSINQVLGSDKYIEVENPVLMADDFGYFAKEVPGVYLFIGCGKKGEEEIPLHSQYFNFDESSLFIGVRALSKVLLNWGWA